MCARRSVHSYHVKKAVLSIVCTPFSKTKIKNRAFDCTLEPKLAVTIGENVPFKPEMLYTLQYQVRKKTGIQTRIKLEGEFRARRYFGLLYVHLTD